VPIAGRLVICNAKGLAVGLIGGQVGTYCGDPYLLRKSARQRIASLREDDRMGETQTRTNSSNARVWQGRYL
jgi:hypothetical protein